MRNWVRTRMCLEALQASVEAVTAQGDDLLPTSGQEQEAVTSEWMVAWVHRETLSQQVWGRFTAAQIRACLPQVQRFLRGNPRTRTHWFTQGCTWLRSPADQEVIPRPTRYIAPMETRSAFVLLQ